MTPDQIRAKVLDKGTEGSEFDVEIKQKVFARQNGFCWMSETLAPIQEIAHIIHRGMGSKSTANHLWNLIGLSARIHLRFDKKAKPWLRIVWFEPEDRKNGLVVEEYDEGEKKWQLVPRERLSFYNSATHL